MQAALSWSVALCSICPGSRRAEVVNPGLQLTQLCVPHMENQGYGRIVFCSSIAAGKFVCFLHLPVFEIMAMLAATGGVLGPHYSSSKAAIHGIMHWVARQYSKKGIVGITISTVPTSHVQPICRDRHAMPSPRP